MKMTEDKRIEMLSEIIQEVDYDIWKDIFLNEGEPDLAEFLGILDKYLGEDYE